MRKIYTLKALVATVLLMLGCISVNALTLEELSGTYQLTANGSLYNGANGLTPSSVVTLGESAQDGFDVAISGFFGQYTWNGLFDEEAQTLSFPYGMVAMSGGFIMMFKVEDGEPVTDGMVTMQVNADGTITFDDQIGVGMLDFGSGEVSILETIDGGKLEKGTFEIDLLSDDEVAGFYLFSANGEPTLADEDEYGDELDKFTADEFGLVVTKDEAAGERHFLVAGFFGSQWAVPAEYTDQGKLVIKSNVMTWFGDEEAQAVSPYRLLVDEDATYFLGTIASDLEFTVEKGMLRTTTGMIALYSMPEDALGEVIISIMGGGTAQRLMDVPPTYEVQTVFTGISQATAAADRKASVYTLDGKLVGQGADLKALNLPHGVYVVRSAEGVKKMAR